jgi:membrane protein
VLIIANGKRKARADGMTDKEQSKINRFFAQRALKAWTRHYLGGLYNRFDDHHVFLLAGGLAFSLFVCLVPMVLIVFSVVGALLEKPSVSDEINAFIDRLIPYQDYADFVKEKVFDRVNEFKLYKSLAGIIGFIGLFFASSGLFSSMRTVLHLVYRRRRREPALVGKLRDFGLVLLVLLYFLLSTAVLPTLEVIKRIATNLKALESLGLGFLGEMAFGAISFALIFAAFFLMYWAIPHGKLPKKMLFLSALTAAVLWEIAKQLFGFYIAHAVTLQRIYGAYILGIAVVFWVYYSSIVFIVGAEVGQLYRERLKKRSSPVVNP